MRAMIDGTLEFEQQYLDVESYSRDAVERTVAGLDGVLSIDLGMRRRRILQRGILRAGSSEALRDRADSFSNLMDGAVHGFELEDGRRFDDLRVDGFKIQTRDCGGAGPSCSFEIRYTQLMRSEED